jgi:hypothetical protein
MATTNLISKSLGDVLVQVGNGNPDHTADKGSYYTNKDTGGLYINLDGSTRWSPFEKISYSQITLTDNTTEITPGSLDQWITTTTLGWTIGFNNGFTHSSGTLTPKTGRDGNYMVIIAACVELDPSFTATYEFEVGLSKNDSDPVGGLFNGTRVGSNVDKSSIGVVGYVDLVAGDTVRIKMRPTSSTTPNLLLNQGNLILIRVGDIQS